MVIKKYLIVVLFFLASGHSLQAAYRPRSNHTPEHKNNKKEQSNRSFYYYLQNSAPETPEEKALYQGWYSLVLLALEVGRTW